MAASSKTFDTEHPYDASFSCGMLLVDGRKITAFSDDADPVTVDECTAAEFVTSVNGSFTIAQKPVFVKIVISVIAGTDDEVVLRSKFQEMTGISKNQTPVKIELVNGHGKKFTFSRCFCLGSTPAFSVNQSGKVQAMRYVFGAISIFNS